MRYIHAVVVVELCHLMLSFNILQIIANKETGIDVDKWDYFERDCYYTGLNCSFDMR